MLLWQIWEIFNTGQSTHHEIKSSISYVGEFFLTSFTFLSLCLLYTFKHMCLLLIFSNYVCIYLALVTILHFYIFLFFFVSWEWSQKWESYHKLISFSNLLNHFFWCDQKLEYILIWVITYHKLFFFLMTRMYFLFFKFLFLISYIS